jgi:hypothetical protein
LSHPVLIRGTIDLVLALCLRWSLGTDLPHLAKIFAYASFGSSEI